MRLGVLPSPLRSPLHPPADALVDRRSWPDAYKWNTIMRGFLEGKKPEQAYMVYNEIRRKGVGVDSHTFVFLLKACGLISSAFAGKQVHGQIFKMGYRSEVVLQTAVQQMYGLLGSLEHAQRVFDETPERDLAQWNAIISIYARWNRPYQVLQISCTMIREHVRPNGMTAVGTISACSSLGLLKVGKLVHGYLIKCCADFDMFVSNALIGMYMSCRSVYHARQVFETMPSKNVISWTSLIDGYKYNDCPFEALSVFKEMEYKLVEPDEVTLLGLVSICSKLGSFEKAQWADEYIQNRGCEHTIHITNALIDMHAKCGNIEKACRIFDRTVNRTLVTWTTMIQGLGLHGHGIEALVRFSQMQREGFKPDAILFLCILCACSHAGLVDEGINCFRSMTEDYSIVPWMDHYGCLVDLLCRAQQVDKAFQFVERMNSEPDEKIWRALLRACKEKGDFVVARKVIIRLLELEPQYGGNYVLASNLFAATGEWDEVKRIREEMSSARVAKTDSAHSFVELATFQR